MVVMCGLWWALVCSANAATPITLRLRDHAVVEGNSVKFGDLVDVVSGQGPQAEALLRKVVCPSPQAGAHQRWTRADVVQQLQLRDLHPASIRWLGPEQVDLRRGVPIESRATASVAPRGATSGLPTRGTVPAFVNEKSMAQAESLVKQAITEYIALKSGQRTAWQVKLSLPVDLVPLLQVKTNIVTISGGNPPWNGEQEFELQIKDRGGLVPRKLQAVLDLPPMVVVSKGQIGREAILNQSMLELAPLRANAGDADGYFTDLEEVIGKQASQSLSSGQPIAKHQLRLPTVIATGELVEVESVAGDIVVKTTGRATESGGVGDLISVQIDARKQRISARVVEPRRVRIDAVAQRTKGR